MSELTYTGKLEMLEIKPPDLHIKWRGGDAIIFRTDGTVIFCPEVEQAECARELVEGIKREWSVGHREKDMRIAKLEAALAAIVKHWRAGEPVHGAAIEDLMDRAEVALRNRN